MLNPIDYSIGLLWGIYIAFVHGIAALMHFIAGKYHELTWIEMLAASLATLGAFVALGAVNRMNRETERTIMLAFVTTAAGLIGYGAATVWPTKWESACDLLLVGGISALMIGSRKRTLWIDPRWMPPLSGSVSIVTWAAFFAAI